MSTVKAVGFSVLAVVLGFFGLSLLFSDLDPSETMTDRLIVTVLFHFASGIVIGYFIPRLWYLSGLVAWGGVILGASGFLTSPAEAPLPFLASLLPALLGGYLGCLAGRKRLIGWLFQRIFQRHR